ncbi:MAG: polysaccharide deacetylase family protein [Thermoplasmata archaeon]|nr:MAG: polysaccharide deacetylase family protein [Thermoplasmata archaeon]
MTISTIISVDVDHFPGSEVGIERFLNIFDKRGLKAVFFVAGKFAEENEDIIKKIHLEGHEIGCHGYSHGLDTSENFVDMKAHEQKKRIIKSSEILMNITGQDVKVFRAPFAKANHITINVLEELGYESDSSVTSMRFDFGMGVGNNLRAFFAARKPYHPSKNNLFKKGDSKILEVPISAFVVPLTMSALRTFGAKEVNYLFNMSSHFFDPVVFYMHPWEVMEMDEIRLWEGLPKRHKRNRGVKALSCLEKFLDYVDSKSRFILFQDILEGEKYHGKK